MANILLIPLILLALCSGPIFRILMEQKIDEFSFFISVSSLFLILTTNFFLQLRKVTENTTQVLNDLKDAKESISKIKDSISELQKRLDALPESDQVASELRILRGLMKQVTAKVVETKTHNNDVSSKTVFDTTEASQTTAKNTRPREPFLDYDDSQILTFLDKAVREDRVQLYVQPTVSLPQRIPVFYECFSRITDDDKNVIRPEQYLPVSDTAGLTAALDNLLLFRCIQLVRHTRREQPNIIFFCNISNKTLTDVEFFTDFIDFMASNY